jgi:hypothetical protein
VKSPPDKCRICIGALIEYEAKKGYQPRTTARSVTWDRTFFFFWNPTSVLLSCGKIAGWTIFMNALVN